MPPKKPRIHYVCTECGETSLKWFGRCPSCEGWNTLVEEVQLPAKERTRSRPDFALKALPLSAAEASDEGRRPTGVEEADRVLGGGVVTASVVLVGGEPGVGKSTLLLQLAAAYAARYGPALYVSGEESAAQVASRARRLRLSHSPVFLLSETRVEVIRAVVEQEKPGLVVIDSVQTMVHPDLDSAPGSVSQVRECASFLAAMAKELGVAVFLVGHVNKEGALAGPKVLEHAVDVVLSFEGNDHTGLRLLRAVKNRFGSTHEVGVFEMGGEGLTAVSNPSELFLAERPAGSPGSVVIPSKAGSRPMLIEVQALVSPTHFGPAPRRQVSGADPSRVAIVLAVLEKRVGLPLGDQDVYVNVAGGVRAYEPACDLGIAVAVASSYHGVALESDAVLFGEVGLAGEVRSVTHAAGRIAEARRLGFRHVVAPVHEDFEGVRISRVRTVADALEAALGLRGGARPSSRPFVSGERGAPR